MAEKITRQVERSHLLLDALDDKEWTTSTALGSVLGIGRQAVKTYIDSLKEIGYPIITARGKGHRLEAPLHEGALLLTEEELFTLFLSLSRSAKDFPEPLIARLRRRLLSRLSSSRRKTAKSLKIATESERGPFFQNLEVLKVLNASFEHGNLVRIVYQGSKDPAPRTRTVLPLQFFPRAECWYLAAWDANKQKDRHFRLDRLLSATSLDEQPALTEPSLLSSAHPWDFGSELHRVRVEVTPTLARWLAENPVHPSQRLEAQAARSIVSFEMRSPAKFVDWLMGLRGFKLLGPDSVLRIMRERATEILETQGTLNTPWEFREH